MSQSIAAWTADRIANNRPVIAVADKTFKFFTYAGMFGVFVLQFTTKGTIGKIATAASKLSSVRFIYRGIFGVQDTIQLPGKLKKSIGSGVEDKQYYAAFAATALVGFDFLYVARGVLNLIPATKSISSKIAPVLPFFVIFFAVNEGVNTWKKKAGEQDPASIRALTYLDVGTEVICSSTEFIISDGVVHAGVKGLVAVTGMVAAAANCSANAIRIWSKPPNREVPAPLAPPVEES